MDVSCAHDRIMQELLALPKVELHLHLDGMVHHTLLYETAIRRGIGLPAGVQSAQDLIPYITIPPSYKSLTDCLRVFEFITPILKGDRIAIRQLTLDACDYLLNNNIM
jgi:adenosine deaminase